MKARRAPPKGQCWAFAVSGTRSLALVARTPPGRLLVSTDEGVHQLLLERRRVSGGLERVVVALGVVPAVAGPLIQPSQNSSAGFRSAIRHAHGDDPALDPSVLDRRQSFHAGCKTAVRSWCRCVGTGSQQVRGVLPKLETWSIASAFERGFKALGEALSIFMGCRRMRPSCRTSAEAGVFHKSVQVAGRRLCF